MQRRTSCVNTLIACAVVALAVAALGFVLPTFAVLQATQWLLYGLLASSLALVWGRAGIFSFGQGAFFGVGAYAYGIAAINWLETTNETFSALLLGALVAAALAAVVGYFMFYGKVADVYVGVITLAMTLVLFTVLSSTADPKYRIGQALLGGYNGMPDVPPLIWPSADGGVELSALHMFVLVVALCAALYALLTWMLIRPFGRVMTAVRENEWRTSVLGFDVRLRKLLVFSLGGGIAGLAGGLYAAWAMFVSPGVFSLQLAALVVIWVLVGGRASLAGAFVGALLVESLTFTLGGSGGSTTPIVLGAVLIAVVLLLPGGLIPAVQAWAYAWMHRSVSQSASRSAGQQDAEATALDAMSASTLPSLNTRAALSLCTQELSKHFGGVQAVRQASVAFAPRGVHCLIGPNGAGKSSFFHLLVGRFAPSSGRILLGGQNISRMPAHARVRLGLGIKLQVASIYNSLSLYENLWLAAYGRLRNSRQAKRRAEQWLDWLALRARAHEPAGALAHGQKQWLEIAMALAGDPAVMLLDEPAAGMTSVERERLVQLLHALGTQTSVVVVEHDMTFVRALQAPVTVLHQGGVFASGSMEDLRRDERILDIYLGRG